ncbi:MAG: gfo/Idh/MocA family oxidoreductase [Candidatus Cloacimonadota bacterium]|nr:MAG: gfo/Idh/MocA family oxidoreductase [Candidatus Cloacimonadota bacterium]
MKNIKLGLIGCGRISTKHFEAIEKIENAEIIACCDIIKQKAEEKANQFNIKEIYENYKEMLDNVKMDAVIIATPSGIHPDIGIDVAKKKINVITEKPMATSLDKADKLIYACDENKVNLFVVKQNRLNPPIRLLKNAIDKGRFGRIYSGSIIVHWTRPQAYYDMADWRGTWEFDGGAFLNQASHYFDLLYWLIGPVESVMAITNTIAHTIEVEDQGVGIIKFRNGALGSVDVSMNTYPKNLEGSITIIGEKGTVKVGGIAVNKIEVWEFKDYNDDDKYVFEADTNPLDVYGFGHLGYLKNVIDVLNGKAKASTDGRSGRKSLEIILAMYRSAKTGKIVNLPL